MKYQVSVRIRSDKDEEHPPYVYERTTIVRLSEFSYGKLNDIIAQTRKDYRASYPHSQGRTTFDVIPPIKVTVLEVD